MATKKASTLKRVTTDEAQKNLSATVNSVARGGRWVVLQDKGKDKAALISLKDLALLMEDIEDALDVKEAEATLKETGSMPWKEVKAKLGL